VRELGSVGSSEGDRLGGFAAACDRLVHASVDVPAERARQRRLLCVLSVAPLFLGAAALAAGNGGMTPAHLLLIIAVLSAAGWGGALAVTSGRFAREVASVALLFGGLAAAFIIAASGGVASPLILLAAGLAIEASWVGESRAARRAGLFAAGFSAVAGVGLSALAAPVAVSQGIAAVHWLVVLAYAVTVFARFPSQSDRAADAATTGHAAIGNLMSAAVLQLAENGEVAAASSRTAEIFRMPPEMLFGQGFFDRILISDRVAWLQAMADIREGARTRAVDLHVRMPGDGTRTDDYVLFQAELLATGAGAEPYAAILRAAPELQRLRAAAAEAREAKDMKDIAQHRFLAVVSHELRTPLNAIIGFSDVLVHEMFGRFADPRQKEYAGLIKTAGDHLLSVVNTILDVSKLEAGAYQLNSEPFDLAGSIELCRAMMDGQAAAKGVRLEIHAARDIGEIRGDSRAVKQILLNLVSNAVKFTPAGGRVVVGAARQGREVRLWVSDTGIGISADDLPLIGNPFTQVENDYTRRHEGTGLGLSLVKGLVSLHGGTMSIESAPGLGTTVTVTLPVHGPEYAVRDQRRIVVMPAPKIPSQGEEHAQIRKAG
jgi:two-component system, cell cycle sensor histidine kinase DivJ